MAQHFEKYMLPVTWKQLNTAAFSADRVDSIKNGDLQGETVQLRTALGRAHFRGNLPTTVPKEH